MTAHTSSDVSRTGATQERITIAFLALAWVFILLRIWTRTWIISNFGWDDLAMIMAGFMFTVFCASVLYIAANGGEAHVTDVARLQLLTKWVIVSETTYVLSMMVLKISLGIFFARIVIQSWHLMLIYVTVGINILSSLAAFFYCIFRCGANLDDYVLQQLRMKCTSKKLDLFMAYQSASFNTLTDLVFLLLPMSILWSSTMDHRSKFSVGFILCIATLGCICSMVRFRYVSGLTEVVDFFWNAVNISLWSTIEAGASIMAGCLATLRPLLKRIFGAFGENSLFSVYIKQISQSLRSGSTAKANSHASAAVRHDTMMSDRTRISWREERRRRNIHADDTESIEFLALPGHGLTASASETGQECQSTELASSSTGGEHLAFSLPPSGSEVHGETEERRKRTSS